MPVFVYRGYKGLKTVKNKICDRRKPQHRIIKDEHVVNGVRFTNVDFIPSFCKTFKDRTIYHSFSSLVSLANQWLLSHKSWEIVSCETVKQYYRHVDNDVDYSAEVCILRIWIKKSDIINTYEFDPIFWFKDFLPTRVGDTFETIENLISRINASIANQRINGKILQIETIKIPASQNWEYKSETTFRADFKQLETSEVHTNVVLGIRIFFQTGEVMDEEMILVDFTPLPQVVKGKMELEPFSALIKRASEWLLNNRDLNFCNAQAIDLKIKENEEAETAITWNVRNENDQEIRFLRIYCTKLTEAASKYLTSMDRVLLYQSKNFKLEAVTFDWRNFHKKIDQWYCEFEDTNEYSVRTKICTVETVVVPPFTDDEDNVSFQHAVDSTMDCNRMKGHLKYSFVAIRIYYEEIID